MRPTFFNPPDPDGGIIRIYPSVAPVSTRQESPRAHPSNVTVVDLMTEKPLAGKCVVINPRYAAGGHSVIQHARLGDIDVAIKHATLSEIAMYRQLSILGNDAPIIKPVGIAKEEPTMLFLPMLSLTLNQLAPGFESLRAQEDQEPYQQALYLLFEFVVNVMGALREVGIVHYDIKPHNIAYDSKEKQFKLFDFGTSIHLQTLGDLPEKSDERGTPLFDWSPEYIAGHRRPPFAIEAWSLGQLLEFMKPDKASFFDMTQSSHLLSLSGREQYEANKEKINTQSISALKAHHEEIDTKIADSTNVDALYDFMRVMLKHADPERRPTYYSMRRAQKKMATLIKPLNPCIIDAVCQIAEKYHPEDSSCSINSHPLSVNTPLSP